MDNVLKGFLALTKDIPYAEEKALAYYLVREMLEDLHAEGKISEDETHEINKIAVNRAHAYLMAAKDEATHSVFLLNAVYCREWDDPEPVEDFASWQEMGKELIGLCITNKSKDLNLV